MPISIQDLDDGLGNIITGWGIITEEEYISFNKKHLTQNKDKLKKEKYSIIDYSAVIKIEVTRKAVEEVSDLCRKLSVDINPGAILAAIVNSDPVYSMSMLWDMLMINTDWEYMAFRSREDAEAWVKERVKEKFEIVDLTFR
jgi:transcriptional regulator